MKNDTLLHKWYNKTISKEELEEFKKRPEYASLVDIDRETSDLKGPEVDTELMLTDILASKKSTTNHKKAQTTSSQAKTRSLSTWIKYGVAASVLLLAGYFMIPTTNNMVTYDIAQAQQVEGTLPDQSTFVLQGNSKLEYDKDTWSANRNIILDGEAFFSVKKGSSFTVETPTGKVVVLGTQFAVVSTDNKFNVECTEGKVSVRPLTDGQNEIILGAGESFRQTIDGPTIIKQIGLTKMKDAALYLVTKELSNQFGLTITPENLNMEEKVTCNFQHTDIRQALKTTVTPLGVQYKILEDNNVKLYRE